VIGFSIAAPVGPIGVLCIRRTLAYGKRAGIASGFGSATADAFFRAAAALDSISDHPKSHTWKEILWAIPVTRRAARGRDIGKVRRSAQNAPDVARRV
jgi:threonine/homoserine/homoserine lactone efflux protein